MSDIHIYLERTHPIRVITLEPTGARGPIGPQGPAGAAGPPGAPGPNSVTSSTTSNGTCDLWLDTLKVGTGTASGAYAVALGDGATASGQNSFACGTETIASQINSFAIGAQTTASGGQSFAAGNGSTASGGISIALGDGCTSSGDFSFTTGISSTASGTFSRAQGSACEATAPYSVAIGRRAKAIYEGSSVETDSQDADVESLLTNEKTFRFANGYQFFGGSATFEGTVYANHIHGNLAGSVYAHVRAGEALAKGDPVYVSGSHGTGANLIPIVSKADASNIAKMPAVGIMDAALANNASGHMVITGTIYDLNTAAYSVNATLYVATGGGLTATPPAANSQPVARVDRANANNGALIVSILSNASNGGNGASDANKLVRFSSAGLIPVASIGGLGTGVGTALTNTTNGTGGFVTADGTATMTNKTLTSPTIDTISGAAVSNVLQNRAGSTRPICVLFEDFPGLTGGGTHPWNDAGTGSTDASSTGGAGNFLGTCRLVTGTTSGNARSRSLGIATSTIFIGAIVRYGFAIPDVTNVNVQIGFSGGGSNCQLYYQSAVNSGQWTLLTNAGTSTFTSATPQAGNYFSGKRYQVEIERISATQTRILLEIADFNLANWSTVHSGTITHSSVSGNWGECTPSFAVTTQTAAARTIIVDWASLHLPMILR